MVLIVVRRERNVNEIVKVHVFFLTQRQSAARSLIHKLTNELINQRSSDPVTRKILVTAPPMSKNIAWFQDDAKRLNLVFHCPDIDQQMIEGELVKIIGDYDGWIAGDDPVNEAVLSAGKAGRLKSVVRWGIGMDNVDRETAERLGFDIKNTPNVFGVDVAEVAVGYCLALARHTFEIDRSVRAGGWPKPTGTTLSGKSIGILGFGDIGKETAYRLKCLGCELSAIYDPSFQPDERMPKLAPTPWPEKLNQLDYLILTAPLNEATKHIINKNSLNAMKRGIKLINVSRGGLVNEQDIEEAISSGIVSSAALEVTETEPLPADSSLRNYDNIIFGCHNASNTKEGIVRATKVALTLITSNH